MSAPFRDLVTWLLDKDPRRRPTWPQLLAHPFWGSCQTPSPLEMPPQPRFDRGLADASSADAADAAATAATAAAATSACLDGTAIEREGEEEVHAASPPSQQQQQQQQQREGEGEREGEEGEREGRAGGRIDDRTVGLCGGSGIGRDEVEVTTGSYSCSSSSSSVDQGLATMSTIESSTAGRRRRRGVTGELNGCESLMSTAELPEEVIEIENVFEGEQELSYDRQAEEEGEEGGRRQGHGEEGLNRWRAQGVGGKTAGSGGDRDRGKAWGARDVGARTDCARKPGGGKIQEEGAGEEEGPRTTPSTPISGTCGAERWRSTHQRRSSQDRPTPAPARSGQARGPTRQHDRDEDADDDHHAAANVPPAFGEVQGVDKGVVFSLPPAAVVAPAAAGRQDEATPVGPRRAPCHDGLLQRRSGGGCGSSSPIGETATTATIVPENGSPGGAASRRRRRREDGAVDNNNVGVDSATKVTAAKRAAAAEALNGLRMRGRIPPVRRGAAAPTSAAAAATAPAVAGRAAGGGGGAGRLGGKTSPSASLLSASVVSVTSVASSSVGEQYGSSFEEDTEGSSCCSGVGGGAGGGWGSEPHAPATIAAASAPGSRKAKTKACGGGGERNAEYGVMTPGSVGTAITATPSSAGILSTTREGREYSAGGVGERLDKARAILTSAGSTASAESGSGSGSGSGCSGAASFANNSDENEFAATALSFRRAAGCYSPTTTSDRVSTSSWTLSAGVSSLRGSREVVSGPYGGQGGSGSGSRIPGEGRQVVAVAGVHGRASPSASAFKVAAPTPTTMGNRSRPSEVGTGRRRAMEQQQEEEDRAAVCSPTAGSSSRNGWKHEARRGASSPPHLQPPPPPPRPQALAVTGGSAAGTGSRGDWCHEASGNVSKGGREGRSGSGGGVGAGRGVSAMAGARRVRGMLAEHDADERDGGGSPAKRGVRELLLHTSDAQVTPIVASRSVDSTGGLCSASASASATQRRSHRTRRPSSRVDQLPFEPLLPETVSAMQTPQLEAHLTVAYNALTEGSSPVRQKGQTLLYLQSLAAIPRVANLVVNSTFLALLLR